MKTKVKRDRSEVEVRLELKYCERCGGLWLRPAGGGQTYCVGCARQMAELPAPSEERNSTRLQQGPRWARKVADHDVIAGDCEQDVEGAGGVA
jgi:Zn-finger nucleic acid-binding protein